MPKTISYLPSTSQEAVSKDLQRAMSAGQTAIVRSLKRGKAYQSEMVRRERFLDDVLNQNGEGQGLRFSAPPECLAAMKAASIDDDHSYERNAFVLDWLEAFGRSARTTKE